MDDITQFYTLSHQPYMDGVLAVQAGEAPFRDGEDNRLAMIVGGGATQLTVRDKSQYLRPTTDIDVILSKHSTKSERKKWAKAVAAQLISMGHPATASLTNHGSEARFNQLPRDLIVHLDCTTSDYFRRHDKRFAIEFERASIEDFGGQRVRYQSPIDIIANKLHRISTIVGYGSAELDSKQKNLFDAAVAGALDDFVMPNFDDESRNLSVRRATNIETLSRQGFGAAKRLITEYKIAKDFYDISLIVDAMRKRGINLEGMELARHYKSLVTL